MSTEMAPEWDYLVVGSGAGGGTLAARLAESGMRVYLLEAGGDAPATAEERMPDDYEVPGFHAFACENPAMSWDFRVRHYADETRQRRDWKYERDRKNEPDRPGVFYPRAATIGGCTAHNAMIFMLPHDSDWDRIAQITGDPSWRAKRMRRYVKRVENCRHRPLRRLLGHIGLDFTGHGWGGWLEIEKAVPHEVLADDGLMRTLIGTVRAFVSRLPFALARSLRWILRGRGDPNARQWPRRSFKGICYTPLSTRNGHRVGARERLLETAAAHPEHLHIETDALATRVLFDDEGNATGVEYLKGPRLYHAHASSGAQDGEMRQVRAKREVILCGGAFNTPQLLMLSGIGPAQELGTHGITVRVDLPGVGRNLQDRYEVALTYRMPQPWEVLAGTEFARGDAKWKDWEESGSGLYSSNGAVVGIVRRSAPTKAEPDLFCMAMVARFEGYFTGFSKWIREYSDYLTWVVLKAHTENRRGVVKLRSKNPRDTPLVNFRYFEEGDDAAGEDLRAVVEGVRFVRRMTASLLAEGAIAEELTPGSTVDGDAALEDYVRDTAWGHHASCTCPIGLREQGGVLDGDFRVHGVQRLRVVDASVFPHIPGIFIVSAVYMIAEKAADVILHDARA